MVRENSVAPVESLNSTITRASPHWGRYAESLFEKYT